MVDLHIEGMGWVGSVLARRLTFAGVPFTWNDTESPICAWHASTGLVYPTGEAHSEDARLAWLRWHDQGHLMGAGRTVEVGYWYSHRNHPHGAGKAVPAKDIGWLRRSPYPALQVDVQGIVLDTRERLSASRLDACPATSRRVIAHGFHEGTSRFVWGWARPVRLAVPADIAMDAAYSLNLYKSRFEFTYAYAMASRPGWHWAGSAMAQQKVPRSLDGEAGYARWLAAVAVVAPPVRVLEVGPLVEGWRPKPAGPLTWECTVDPDGTVRAPALYHSGVRWAPLVTDSILHALGVAA